MAPRYDDGTDASRKASSVSGKMLPEPRDISNIIFSQKLYNEYGWQYAIAPFGQLIAHDVTNAASSMGIYIFEIIMVVLKLEIGLNER